MTIKEELQSLKGLSKMIDAKERELSQLKRYYKTLQGIDYTKEKINGGRRVDFTETVNKIIDLESEITADIDALCDKKESINKKIKDVVFGEEYIIIQLRYFEDLKWEEICVKINASWRKTHYIHSRALKKLENNKSLHTIAH